MAPNLAYFGHRTNLLYLVKNLVDGKYKPYPCFSVQGTCKIVLFEYMYVYEIQTSEHIDDSQQTRYAAQPSCDHQSRYVDIWKCETTG